MFAFHEEEIVKVYSFLDKVTKESEIARARNERCYDFVH